VKLCFRSCKQDWYRTQLFSFYVVSWLGVRLSALGTAATNCPIVPAPDYRWWVWRNRWNENWQGKPKYPEKTCHSATLSITNPTWLDLSSNPGRSGGKPATNRLSYDTTFRIATLRFNIILRFRPFVHHQTLYIQCQPDCRFSALRSAYIWHIAGFYI
jgi:hypothetical protein